MSTEFSDPENMFPLIFTKTNIFQMQYFYARGVYSLTETWANILQSGFRYNRCFVNKTLVAAWE